MDGDPSRRFAPRGRCRNGLAPQLEEAAERLEGTGALLLAAEASCEAARAFRDAGFPAQATSWAQDRGARRRRPSGQDPRPRGHRAGRAGRRRGEWREVVALAASGGSRVADRPSSPCGTVDSHLLRAYAKLGVTGRKDLTAALGRAGRSRGRRLGDRAGDADRRGLRRREGACEIEQQMTDDERFSLLVSFMGRNKVVREADRGPGRDVPISAGYVPGVARLGGPRRSMTTPPSASPTRNTGRGTPPPPSPPRSARCHLQSLSARQAGTDRRARGTQPRLQRAAGRRESRSPVTPATGAISSTCRRILFSRACSPLSGSPSRQKASSP